MNWYGLFFSSLSDLLNPLEEKGEKVEPFLYLILVVNLYQPNPSKTYRKKKTAKAPRKPLNLPTGVGKDDV